MTDVDRKLRIVAAVFIRSMPAAAARPGRQRVIVRPVPTVYDAVAAEFGITRDRVSHLANDRALWRKASKAVTARLSGASTTRLRRPIPTEPLTAAQRIVVKDSVMPGVNAMLRDVRALGHISDEQAREMRRDIEKALAESKVPRIK